LALLDAALRGGVDVVQLRDKELPDDELIRAAEPFRRACDRHGALFVLNDRPDLVERAHADGVHVGREDVSLADARRAVGPDRLVGLSASVVDEFQGDPDYFGVGAVFGTPTKPEAEPGGLALVRAARDRLRVPWFAIGGIDADTIEDVAASGAAGVAVVRAVRDAAEPEKAARALRALLPPTDVVVAEGDKEIRLPQIDWLESSLPPGEPGRAPAHACGAYRCLLCPRGRDRDAAWRRAGPPACGIVCSSAAAASARVPQSRRDRGALPECARARRMGERPAAARARGIRHVFRSRHRLHTRSRDHHRPG